MSRFIAFAVGLVALLLTACGGETTTTSTTAADTDASVEQPAEEPSVEDVAEANIKTLQTADDALDTELVSVTDGSVASLRAAVDGDRPVLLWFWAPH